MVRKLEDGKDGIILSHPKYQYDPSVYIIIIAHYESYTF